MGPSLGPEDGIRELCPITGHSTLVPGDRAPWGRPLPTPTASELAGTGAGLHPAGVKVPLCAFGRRWASADAVVFLVSFALFTFCSQLYYY